MARARKPSVTNAPTRRSARLASREVSVEVVDSSSSTAVLPAKQQQRRPRPRRVAAVQELRQLSPIPASPTDATSSKLAAATPTVAESPKAASPSAEPSVTAPEAVQTIEPASVAVDSPAPVPTSPAAPTSPTPGSRLPAAVAVEWDTEEVVRLVIEENEFGLISELTEWQSKAVALSLAEKAQQQAAEIADLREKVEEKEQALLFAQRRTMSARFRNMSLQKIEDQYKEAKAKERAEMEAEILAKYDTDRKNTTAELATVPQHEDMAQEVTNSEHEHTTVLQTEEWQEQSTAKKAREPRRFRYTSEMAKEPEQQDNTLDQDVSSPAASQISSFVSADLVGSTPFATAARRAPQEPEYSSPAGSYTAATTRPMHSADVVTRPPMRPPTPEPATTPWRRVVNFLSSPFVGRKRAAAEMEEDTPQPPATAPVNRRREDADDADLPLHKRVRIEHKTTPYTSRNPARRPRPLPQTTPRLSHHDQPQRSRLVPSAKNSRIPTSLKTVTEYTESLLSPVNDLPDPTPSKPAKPLKSSETGDMAEAFPESSLVSQSASLTDANKESAAPDMPAVPVRDKGAISRPRIRRWEDRQRLPMKRKADDDEDQWIYDRCLGPNGRVHKDSGFLPTDGKRLYAWEKPAPQQDGMHTPRTYGAFSRNPTPRVPNAEERLAKIQRFRDLQRELGAAAADKDIIDVMSRKVKRVKVDHLTVIPHNRPGDPSSTFRVPEIDSDDEMEVVESDSMSSNMFMQQEEDEKPSELVKAAPATAPSVATSVAPAVAPSVAPAATPVREEQTTPELWTLEIEETEDVKQARSLFPDVGPIPEGYVRTAAYMEECRLKFLDILTEYGVPHQL